MRNLPRRVPWTCIAELDQVCSWIYTDQNDMETKRLAISRISAWRAVTALPHALESTLSLLAIIIDDETRSGSNSHLVLRQSYAAAIIRLVNGLVDPLQLGAYARSIASIAAQLGLPQWLVELRHAATHENLPSLELLREGARQSMIWLLHNYWIPTINPVPPSQVQTKPVRPLTPILKQYKALMKSTMRDASLKGKYKQNLQSLLKDVERWLAEAMINASGQLAWDSHDEERERFALQQLCDPFLEKGSLVPLAKKKRIFPADSFDPPAPSVQLWEPLLTHLQSLHHEFAMTLVKRIIQQLCTHQAAQPDQSFDLCLARWALWTASVLSKGADVKRDAITTLVIAIGSPNDKQNVSSAEALLKALCADDADLAAKVTVLLEHPSGVVSVDWHAGDLDVMNERLSTVVSMAEEQAEDVIAAVPDVCTIDDLDIPGWQLLGDWKPCPIGSLS